MPIKQIIDFHSHVVPGVDDGCPNMEQALQMIELYKKQNVEAVICTPHYGSCAIPDMDQEKAFRELAAVVDGVKLYLGNEVLYTPGVEKELKSGKAHTMAGSDVALVEFDEWRSFHTPADEIIAGLAAIRRAGYRVALAHAERYKSLRERPWLYRDLVETQAVRIQVNAWDVAGRDDDEIRRVTRDLLLKGYVSFLGSDSHGMEHRPPFLLEGAKWIYENCDERYADAVVHDDAWNLINEKGGAG